MPYVGEAVYFYEVPRIQFVERIVEVPRFSVTEGEPVKHQKPQWEELPGVGNASMNVLNSRSSEEGATSVRPESANEAPGGRWESLVHRAAILHDRQSKSDFAKNRLDYVAQVAADNAETLDRWVPIDELIVGDVIRVEEHFTSSDESLRVMLRKQTIGVVESMDADGDALIRFPSLTGLRCSARWVLRTSFVNMSMCRPSKKR